MNEFQFVPKPQAAQQLASVSTTATSLTLTAAGGDYLDISCPTADIRVRLGTAATGEDATVASQLVRIGERLELKRFDGTTVYAYLSCKAEAGSGHVVEVQHGTKRQV